MFKLEVGNAAEYLAGRGFDTSGSRVRELAGGVSGTVLLVEGSAGRIVLKQALEQLRVSQEWLADGRRALREAEAIRLLRSDFPQGALPEILFSDSKNFLFAMCAAPESSRNWKDLLLSGVIDAKTAEHVGILHATLIAVSWNSKEWQEGFGDLKVFDQLRLDPYYRATARVHPDLADFYEELVADAFRRCVSLVHGDWSPKNFLIGRGMPMALDFEVTHYGNPAFDAAFLLNHFFLKSFHRPECRVAYLIAARRYWETLASRLPRGTGWFETATLAHLGGLMLARVDGKSQIEYLDDSARARVRTFARGIIERRPANLEEAFRRVQAQCW